MIHLSHTLVLLDTNVLVHLARQDATGVWIEDQFALTARADRPLISTINTVRPEFCCSEFVIAIIEHVCCRHGQQMGALRGRPIG